MKKTAIGILSTVLVIFIAWLAITQMSGRPMSTDLSQVGRGEPTIVLAFENYAPSSMDAIDQLNRVRGNYEPEVLFLVADLGTPDGRTFSTRFGLSPGSAVLVDGAGSPVRTYSLRGSEWPHSLDRDLQGLLASE